MSSDPHPLRSVTVTDHLWIPMPDGVRLAARLWLPDEAAASPVPAIFEYIPYRKADMVRARDERNHPFFAANGYACLRVDMRGSGDSEGVMPDMYDVNELADARHVIDWIAAQSWCSGSVGMFGTSWGGTASLQANIDAPEALKAVIAVCATHDRYEDDIHHMGGCLLTDSFEWGATLPAILAAPPTPNVGDDWQELWQDRLDNLTFPIEAWVREEARGSYWRHGSVIHQADRLARPVLAVGGWSDRYSNSVLSLVAARPDLVSGVVGPWGHHYPDHGRPGPAIGFQQLALAWWDRWLRPEGDASDWPKLQVWLREFDPPSDALAQRNGQWVESGAPPETTSPSVMHFGQNGLEPKVQASEAGWAIPNDLRVGRGAGDTGYFGRSGGLPLDQQADDSRSLVFETAPLQEDLVVLGSASVCLNIGANASLGQVSVRLNDVAPDGRSAQVAMAVRNLALDSALDAPEAAPTAAGSYEIRMPTTAYRFQKGHRIRLALASSYWPLVWPSPSAVDLTVLDGSLSLPVCKSPPKSLRAALPEAEDLPRQKTFHTTVSAPLRRFQTVENGELTDGWEQPFSEVHFRETGVSFGYATRSEHRITPADPTSATTRCDHHARYDRPDGVADIRSMVAVTCDADYFFVNGSLTADWNGDRRKDQSWSISIPRRFG